MPTSVVLQSASLPLPSHHGWAWSRQLALLAFEELHVKSKDNIRRVTEVLAA